MINEHINKCPGLQQKTFQSIFIRTSITSSWCFPFNTIWSQKECSVILTNISPHYLLTFDQEGVFSTQALPMLTGGWGLAKQVFLLQPNVNKGENLATAPKTHSLAHLKNPERWFWEESRPAPLRERKSIGQEGQLQRAVRQEHTVCPPGHYDYHIDRSVSQSQNHKHYQRHRPRNWLHDFS